MTQPTPIERLRAALVADEGAQLRLAPLTDLRVFLDAITAYAEELGLAIPRDIFAVGLARAAAPKAQLQLPTLILDEAPPRHWLPVELKRHQGAIVIEWLHFAGVPLGDVAFEATMAWARGLPFNRLMRCATPLAAIDPFSDGPPPDGLLFHMSRCGATLVGQMIAAAPGHIVLTVPPILDTMIRLVGHGAVPPSAIRQIAGALTRDRDGDARGRVLILDAWHTPVLPLLRGLWPDTPWTFLYRNPIEVLVSQQRQPAMHVRRGVLPIDAYGLRDADAAGDYAAWIHDRICRAAADAFDSDGLLVNYDQLPAAVTDAILPHFGVEADAATRALIVAAGDRHAEPPVRHEASFALRAAAAPLLATYARLEEQRLAAASPHPASVA